MAKIQLLKGLSTGLDTKAIAEGQLLFTTDTGKIYLDIDGTTRIQLYKGLETDIEDLKTLVGTDSVADQIADALTTLVAEVVAGDGIEVDKTDVTKPIVKAKLSTDTGNSLAIGTDGGLFVNAPASTDYTVTVTEAAGEAADLYSKRYTIAQTATSLSVNIDIPKDMVVESGTVETFTDDSLPAGVTTAGTYLVLTLANATSDTLYISVGDLIEYVTSGSTVGDMIVIDVSADHKITATITDGTVTKAKLEATVQTSLGLADTAVQPAELAAAVETGKFVAGITVDGDGNITVEKAEVGLEWGTF